MSSDTYLVEKLKEILLRLHFPSPSPPVSTDDKNNHIPILDEFKLKPETSVVKSLHGNELEYETTDVALKRNLNEFIQALKLSLDSTAATSPSGIRQEQNQFTLPIMTDSVTEYDLNLTDDDVYNLNNLMSSVETDSIGVKQIFIIGLYICIACIAIIGNLLVVELVIRSRRLHTLTHALLANLAVADLFMAGLNIPFSISRVILIEWPFGSFLCQLIPFVQVTSVYVTSITMASIALDRFHVIMNPLGRRMKTSEGVLLVVVIWLLSGVLALPYAIHHKVVTILTVRIVKRCQAEFDSIYSRRWLTIGTFFAQYLIPLVITSISYISIMHHLGKRTSGLGSATPRQIEAQSRGKRTTIKMLVLTVIFFAVCFAPINIYHILTHFGIVRHNSTAILICHLIAMSSTCYNPPIYCWLNDHFKSEASKWLKCFRTKRSPVVYPGIEVNGILTRNDLYRRNQCATAAGTAGGSLNTRSQHLHPSRSVRATEPSSNPIIPSALNATTSTRRNVYEEQTLPRNFMRRVHRGIFPPELLFLTRSSISQQYEETTEDNENGDEDCDETNNVDNIESDFEQDVVSRINGSCNNAAELDEKGSSESNAIPMEIFSGDPWNSERN